MHEGARAFIAQQASRYAPYERVLEIGSRNVNGSVREYFQAGVYLGIDLLAGDGVDIVADAAKWQPNGQFDAIVCCETFEHTPEWPTIVRNISLWLRPGGIALLTMASTGRAPHSGVDGGPVRPGEFYQNVEPEELAAVCDGFNLNVTLDTSTPGDLYAICVS
jgi:SAM-dependent methyltransferase